MSTENNNHAMLRVRGLKKYFPIYKGLFRSLKGTVKAVDNVSFDLHAKETLGVVGESGCGKTTVGRSLLRLIEPTAGRADFLGEDIFKLDQRRLRDFRRHMQIIFQDPYSSLNPRMTIGSIIGDALELHGIATGDDKFEIAVDLQKGSQSRLNVFRYRLPACLPSFLPVCLWRPA